MKRQDHDRYPRTRVAAAHLRPNPNHRGGRRIGGCGESGQIPHYLQRQSYRIVPVNPRGGQLFGERVFRSLAEVDVPVDVVHVFRPAAEAPEIARQAIAIGA
jgi:hypothetical protein